MKILLTSDLHYGYMPETKNRLDKFFRKFKKKNKPKYQADCLILAGDIISDNKDQIEGCLKLIRRYVEMPIFAVLGNHDLWGTRVEIHMAYGMQEVIDEEWYEARIRLWKDMFSKYDIWYLPNNPTEYKGVTFLGYNGWYGGNTLSSDKNWIPSYIHGEKTDDYLRHHAYLELQKILDYDTNGKKTVVVTHVTPVVDNPLYTDMCAHPRDLYFVTEKADLFCVGHSHRRHFFTQNNCMVVNSGSDYNKPNLINIDLDHN